MPLKRNNKNSQSWRDQRSRYVSVQKERARKNALKRNSSFNTVRKRKSKKKFSFWSLFLNKKFLKFAFFLGLAGIIFLMGLFIVISGDLPDPEKLSDREIAQSTQILDRTGEKVLYEIHGAEKRTLVNLEELPDYIKFATIAIEDKNFYHHKGISFWGIFRGVIWRKITGRSVQGGSTLTQQFIKNAILTSERTVTRKFKEWILAYKIEQKYSKDEILQMYFNEIPYGSTAYGVEAASQRYFGKSAHDITLAEAAILAALPQAPSKYSPYGSNKDLLIGRQQYILDLMFDQGYITEEERDEAKAQELDFKKPSTNITAPHFVMYVKELLSEKYGEKMIEQEGLKIYTTLDLYKQEIAEEMIDKYVEKNEENYDATNAALVSIDPRNGQIMAMVGSRDYFDEEIDGQFNVSTAARQPGSSLKPLVYASSFIKGYTPNTVFYDVVTNFADTENEDEFYEPHNYDDQEHGPVSIRKALAGSLNVPAVKALYLAGIDDTLELAKDMGYTTLDDRERFGLSLVLGGGEVKLLEHVNAYGIFAREGETYPTAAILRVEDKDGNILEEWEEKKDKVLDTRVARMINDVLSDNDARAYAFGIDNWLNLGERPVAAKTGTTNDYRDAWTIGYTPSIVTGVWVGNNDNSAMRRGAAGGSVAAPIWHDYMKKVLGDTPIEEFKKLTQEEMKTGKAVIDGDVSQGSLFRIDKASGLLATEYTPDTFIEEVKYQQAHSILFYVDKKNPLGDAPKNPEKDVQFRLWEDRVLAWANEEGLASSSPPTEYDNVHVPENIPEFEILSPANVQAVTEVFFNSRIQATAPRGINRAEYFIDGNRVFTNYSYPFNMEKQINFLKNGYHNLSVRVCDDIDNCAEKSVEFNLILDREGDINTETSASWYSPSNGLALTNIDFPLNMSFSVSNPEQVASIKVFASFENGEEELATTIYPEGQSIASGKWLFIPSTGSYKLRAEMYNWEDEKKDVGEIIISVNNINDKKESDTQEDE